MLFRSPALTTTWQKVTHTATLSSAAAEAAGYVSIYLVYLAQNSAAVSFDIAHVQLEQGSIATSFECRPYATEVLLCQRYYVNLGYPTAGSTIGITCNVTSGANYHYSFQFPTLMRAAPTLTWTEWTSSNFPGTSATFQSTGIGGTNVYKNANGTGQGYFLGGYTATAEL